MDNKEYQAEPRLEMTPEQMINALKNVLHYSNVIDLAKYNNKLTEYMFHWEGRAIEAEQEVERLQSINDDIMQINARLRDEKREQLDEIERLREAIKDSQSFALKNLATQGQLHDEIDRLREALQQVIDLPEDSRIHYKVARAALKESE